MSDLPNVDKYSMGWAGMLTKDSRGDAYPNLPNALFIMGIDARWKGVFRFNEMEKRIYVHKEIPKDLPPVPIEPRPITDLDEERARTWMQSFGIMPMMQSQTMSSAIAQIAHADQYHPLREEVLGWKWDGVPRVRGWLTTYFGVEATPYSEAIGTMFLVSMHRRLFMPGCQMDYMLILEGAQGKGKTTACQILAGEEYYMEGHFKDLASADTAIALRNKWLIEFGEMHAIRKAEINELKMWLTRKREDYRPKYGRHNIVEPRQCVFMGTANNSEYIKDDTGGRRFWPVWCNKVEIEMFRTDRDQLLAEAYQLMKNGEPHYPTPEFEVEHFKPEQEKRRVGDPWEVFIQPLATSNIGKITYEMILNKLNLSKDKADAYTFTRITNIMATFGWIKVRDKTGMVFRRKPTEPAEPVIVPPKLELRETPADVKVPEEMPDETDDQRYHREAMEKAKTDGLRKLAEKKPGT